MEVARRSDTFLWVHRKSTIAMIFVKQLLTTFAGSS
jgi:hypothetical protein